MIVRNDLIERLRNGSEINHAPIGREAADAIEEEMRHHMATCMGLHEAQERIAALEAENSVLMDNAICAANVALRAEIAKLRELVYTPDDGKTWKEVAAIQLENLVKLRDAIAPMQNYLEKLEAENAKLLGALEKIASGELADEIEFARAVLQNAPLDQSRSVHNGNGDTAGASEAANAGSALSAGREE